MINYENQDIVVDGEVIDPDDMTFKEQRRMRDVIRGLVGDPNLDLNDVDLMDFLPAVVFVVKQRTNAKYELDDALDLKPADVLQERKKRPTKAAKTAA